MILSGRVALITGSTGGGIGRSIALTLASNGADITLNYGTHRTDSAAAQAVQAAVENMGRKAQFIRADTRRAAEVENMVKQVIDTFGKVDILVNNAGGGWDPHDITELSPEQFRSEIAAEIDGAFYCVRACLPNMRRQQWGRIINLGAFGAGHWAAEHGEPLEFAIGKGGRALLTRHLALKERQHNITVNLINPGPGHTPHFESLDDALQHVQHEPVWLERQHATPQDIADAVLFLCTEQARFITGSHINFAIN